MLEYINDVCSAPSPITSSLRSFGHSPSFCLYLRWDFRQYWVGVNTKWNTMRKHESDFSAFLYGLIACHNCPKPMAPAVDRVTGFEVSEAD